MIDAARQVCHRRADEKGKRGYEGTRRFRRCGENSHGQRAETKELIVAGPSPHSSHLPAAARVQLCLLWAAIATTGHRLRPAGDGEGAPEQPQRRGCAPGLSPGRPPLACPRWRPRRRPAVLPYSERSTTSVEQRKRGRCPSGRGDGSVPGSMCTSEQKARSPPARPSGGRDRGPERGVSTVCQSAPDAGHLPRSGSPPRSSTGATHQLGSGGPSRRQVPVDTLYSPPGRQEGLFSWVDT